MLQKELWRHTNRLLVAAHLGCATRELVDRYRYLETTGAVKGKRDSKPSKRHRHQFAARAAMSRAGHGLGWRGKQIPHVVYGLVPESLARENLVFPIGVEGETLKLAAVSHDDVALADKISFVLARPVRLIPASAGK